MGGHCATKRGTLLMGDHSRGKESLDPKDEGNQEEPEDETCLGYGTLSEDDELDGEANYLTYMREVDGHHFDVPLWVVKCVLATLNLEVA